NQVYLITSEDDQAFAESLNIASISRTVQNAQRTFTDWAKPERSESRTLGNLLEKLDSGFFKLLDGLTIARSRKHIEKYYDLSAIGKFPERLPPLVRAPEIDNKKRFPGYDEVFGLISGFTLSVYNPSKYLLQEHVDRYAENQAQ